MGKNGCKARGYVSDGSIAIPSEVRVILIVKSVVFDDGATDGE